VGSKIAVGAKIPKHNPGLMNAKNLERSCFFGHAVTNSPFLIISSTPFFHFGLLIGSLSPVRHGETV
jgi:hypothetical protein